VIAVLAAPGRAEACDPNRNPTGFNHYAVIRTFHAAGADRGARVLLKTDQMSSDTSNTQLVNHELWYSVTGDGSHWVEVGVTDGPVHDEVFWGDNRAGGGYHEHYPGVSWQLGSFYEAKVSYAGLRCAWNVYFGGVYLGTSTSNCAGPQRGLAAGIESTHANGNPSLSGHLADWEKLEDGSWSFGWDDVASYSSCPADIIRIFGVLPSDEYTHQVLYGPA
jgi:hypothetical protein